MSQARQRCTYVPALLRALLLTLAIAAQALAAAPDDPELERAQTAYEEAFERYTRLVTVGGEGDVAQALADYRAAKQQLDEVKARRLPGERNDPGDSAAPDRPIADAPVGATPNPPSDLDAERQAVLAALRALVDAQARGDVAAMQAALATAHLTDTERRTLADALQRTGKNLRFRDVDITPYAVGISAGGQWALLSYQYRMTIAAGGVELPQAGGNLALLARESNRWKVQQIVIDEALTLASYRLVGGPPTARQESGGESRARATPARAFGLLEPDAVRDAINRSIDEWRVDEGKLTRDGMYSLFGRIPIVGDAVSNGYTIYERLKTLAVELPADVRAGNLDATLLDICLVAWGGAQIVAEYIPYLDNLTDAVESGIEAYRYNSVQRFNYLELLKQLQQQDFKALAKYLFLRPTSRRTFDLSRTSLHVQTSSDWHGRWPALRAIDTLSDALLRTDPRIVFSVGAELEIVKSNNETLFTLAKDLGVRTAPSGSFDDEAAYVPLNLTRMTVADASVGDAVLTDFRLPPRTPFVLYRLTCQRGEQTLRVKLKDGTETVPVQVRNLPFNLIESLTFHEDLRANVDELQVNVGAIRTGLRVQAGLAANKEGLEVQPPEILGSKCVQLHLTGSAIADARAVGDWPNSTLTVSGKSPGMALLEFTWPRTQGLRELKLPLVISVRGETQPVQIPSIEGEWTMTSVITSTNVPEHDVGNSESLPVRFRNGKLEMLVSNEDGDGSDWQTFGPYAVKPTEHGIRVEASFGISDVRQWMNFDLRRKGNGWEGQIEMRTSTAPFDTSVPEVEEGSVTLVPRR
ncbi:MAG: hypothetical protein HYX75_02040 [Acidobacteria bacterium]|nr:hypothetical protein [Acidobacteriota bacterium]